MRIFLFLIVLAVLAFILALIWQIVKLWEQVRMWEEFMGVFRGTKNAPKKKRDDL